jgi:hypothetical protein
MNYSAGRRQKKKAVVQQMYCHAHVTLYGGFETHFKAAVLYALILTTP